MERSGCKRGHEGQKVKVTEEINHLSNFQTRSPKETGNANNNIKWAF